MNKHPVQESGHLKSYLSKDKTVRASVLKATELVEAVCQLQKTSPTSSVALGRLLCGTVLLASQLKDQQAIALQVNGSKQIKKIFAHAQYDGLCRAYISEKQAPLSVVNNRLSLEPLIGIGILQAMTYVPNQKMPQISQIELASSEIGEDIAYYLNQSRQIPCIVSLAVKIGSEGQVTAAGGVLIELMPGHTEETLKKLEEHQKKAQALSSLIEKGDSFDDMLKNHMGDIPFTELKSNDVNYGCTCSREKAASSLKLLEAKDFDEILTSKETLNVDCEMCGLVYSFDYSEINLIYKESGKAPIH